MARAKNAVILLLLTLVVFLSVACGALSGGSLPGMPDFAATDTQEALQNAATPRSPLSGDWPTTIDGGKVTFHIARDGSRINSADVELHGWHCGGTTLTTTMQVRSSTWVIDNNAFSANIDLNPPHIEELTFDGTYDEASNTWSGTWDGDEYGAHCGGKWQASQ